MRAAGGCGIDGLSVPAVSRHDASDASAEASRRKIAIDATVRKKSHGDARGVTRRNALHTAKSALKALYGSKNRLTQQKSLYAAKRAPHGGAQIHFFGAEMIASLTKRLRAAQNVCACLSPGSSLRARAIAFGPSKLLAQFEPLGPPVASASRCSTRPAPH